jgi:hypothetical protein
VRLKKRWIIKIVLHVLEHLSLHVRRNDKFMLRAKLTQDVFSVSAGTMAEVEHDGSVKDDRASHRPIPPLR